MNISGVQAVFDPFFQWDLLYIKIGLCYHEQVEKYINCIDKRRVKMNGNGNVSLLIKDTTKEEREKIVAESIGNISGMCDGCNSYISDVITLDDLFEG